ncbi:MAG TPA: flagellar basal-body rod protein FlgF [Candidatus Baltobacteraceae bacterium]|nr:flagellar basal-body rod protein FlgF [Candidatus Baltobacteraceae bacterium]
MVRGLYTAASGALVAQAQADTIANNLANVNTTGFKRTLLQVQSARPMDVYLTAKSSSSYVGSLGTGAEVGDTPAVFEQGSLKSTGNPLDTALMGNGFFSVQTPAGVRYTRDGQFARDNNGLLVTLDGNRVLGRNGPIQLGNGDVTVAQNGDVMQNNRVVDTLRIVQFQNPTAVRPEGDSLFADTGAANPQLDTATSVHQGFLENSNANVVRSMVDLITAQRWFDANQKVIQTQDTANGYAIANVGRSSGQ